MILEPLVVSGAGELAVISRCTATILKFIIVLYSKCKPSCRIGLFFEVVDLRLIGADVPGLVTFPSRLLRSFDLQSLRLVGPVFLALNF